MEEQDLSRLEAFVHARLDDIERTARAAGKDGGRYWELVAHQRGDGAVYDDKGNPVLLYDTDPATGLPTAPDTHPLGARQAAHIALNDPGMTADWVQSQRALLQLLRPTAMYPRALRACAEPFRAHPDCLPGWRP